MKKIINCLFALLVLEVFKDKNDHAKVYQPGDHLETDDLSRVNDLVKRGLAKIESVGVAEDAAGDDANGNERMYWTKYEYENNVAPSENAVPEG